MKYYQLVLILSLFFFIGCASVIMPTIQIPCPPGKDNNSITAAIVLVLQDYNISAEVVSPEIGMVSTVPFTVSSNFLETTNALLGVRYKQTMKLTIVTDNQNNLIVIKPLKQELRGLRGWVTVKLSDKDKAFLEKINKDITQKLSISTEKIQ